MITAAVFSVGVVVCALGILKASKLVSRHPGQRAARRRDTGMASPDNGIEIIFDAPHYPIERPAEITVHDLPAVTDFFEEDEDPAVIERRYNERPKVTTAPPEPEIGPDPDPDATNPWPVAIPPAGPELNFGSPVLLEANDWTGMDYGDGYLEELSADEWLQPLQTGTNGRAVRRLKGLMQDRGWTDRGRRETTPRHVGKRHKKRTLGRLNPVEVHRDRARRDATPGGRHRRTDGSSMDD